MVSRNLERVNENDGFKMTVLESALIDGILNENSMSVIFEIQPVYMFPMSYLLSSCLRELCQMPSKKLLPVSTLQKQAFRPKLNIYYNYWYYIFHSSDPDINYKPTSCTHNPTSSTFL